MSDVPLTRITNDADPERCQGSVPATGQCRNKRSPGSEFCPVHGTQQVHTQKVAQNRQYRLNKWRNRLSEFADAPEIKSLREEIGIVRITLEEVMNQCNSANDIIIYSDKICKMVQQIDALVTSCHRMEEKTGTMLDKTKISQILDVILAAITSVITDPDILTNITAQIEVNLCQTLAVSLSSGSSPVSVGQALLTQVDGRVNTA